MTTKSSKGKPGGNRQRAWLVWLTILVTSLGIASWSMNRWWLWAIAPPSLVKENLPAEALPKANSKNTLKPQKIRVTIPPNTPLQAVGERLETAGVIRSGLALRLWVKLSNDSAPQAGTYEFLSSQNLSEVVTQMQSGKLAEFKFTIAEGWSVAQIGAYFEQEGLFKAADFIVAANEVTKQRAKHPWLPQNIPNLEGYLFPDTYQIYAEDVTPERVIDLMVTQFEQAALPLYISSQSKKSEKIQPKKILPEKMQQHKSTKVNHLSKKPIVSKLIPNLSLHEWVTLASIVEKEAVLSEERSRISGVFINRLQKGMRLESDPTVEYALGIKQTIQQPLTLRQVQIPSPYNTYLNAGLPPGAIAAPGLASLKATLNPSNTAELFFVARYDGSHIFSHTYEQHKLAIAKVEKSLKP